MFQISSNIAKRKHWKCEMAEKSRRALNHVVLLCYLVQLMAQIPGLNFMYLFSLLQQLFFPFANCTLARVSMLFASMTAAYATQKQRRINLIFFPHFLPDLVTCQFLPNSQLCHSIQQLPNNWGWSLHSSFSNCCSCCNTGQHDTLRVCAIHPLTHTWVHRLG